MIVGLAASLFAAAALAWHFQRHPPRRMPLSFARLLPEPPDGPERERRLSLSPPLSSAAFWLHLLLVALVLASIWADWRLRQGIVPQRIGLRIVLDVTDSMSISEGGPSRLDLAKEAVEFTGRAAREAAGDARYCEEIFLVGRDIARLDADGDLARVASRREGGDARRLVEAATLPDGDCLATHVLVVSDLPEPVESWPEERPRPIWRQVGAPLPNAAIASLRYRPPGLGGGPGRLEAVVETYGDQKLPRLTLSGPGGESRPRLEPSLDRDGRFLASIEPGRPGEYVARLEDGGAYAGDDRVEFALDSALETSLDWRLDSWPPPPNLAEAGEDAAAVVALEDLDGSFAERPVVAAYDGWSGGAGPGRIGVFVEDSALLEPLNFDALERFMPAGISHPLPEGFAPVLASEDGMPLIARRTAPPGLIVPAPAGDRDSDLAALSLTLFFSAVQDVAGREFAPVDASWRSADGSPIPDAWKESDTARPLSEASEVDFAAVERDGGPEPVWPWLLLVALAALTVERMLALRSAARRRRRVAL